MGNPSTRNSLMVRKVFYEEVFVPAKHFYEIIMHSNVYNTGKQNKDGLTLWELLNQYSGILFNTEQRHRQIELEAQYLR